MGQYLPILALLVLAVVFGVLSRVASQILAPRQPTAAKSMPYECGITSITSQPERFPVTFYLVAMIFIVFDIEIIFLFPWATVFGELGGFGFGVIAIFAICVFESFVYLISNGALDWGPALRARQALHVSPARTTESTIRRVGLEGRHSSVTATTPNPERPAAAVAPGDPDSSGEAA
jgi:NADH-quinone oxidoreductase subunit A